MRIESRRRPAVALVLWMLAGWAGCATFDRGKSLVPSKPSARTGPFVIYSNTGASGEASAVRCLEALERDAGRELGFRPSADQSPVEIYVLDSREDFDHFLRFYYPELPTRRAFFIAMGSQRLVYTYASPRLDEDLRHEATHAMLHGAFGEMPLWLDEGLAEYFETDRSDPGAERKRLELIAEDLARGWKPDLARLEAMADIKQMTQRDYRESWSWVRMMLRGPEEGRTILMEYLGEPERAGARIAPRLAAARIDERALVAYLEGLRKPGGLAEKPAPAVTPASGSVRMQDGPEPPHRRTIRGFLHRIGFWIGF